jgi:hypothetical protein
MWDCFIRTIFQKVLLFSIFLILRTCAIVTRSKYILLKVIVFHSCILP